MIYYKMNTELQPMKHVSCNKQLYQVTLLQFIIKMHVQEMKYTIVAPGLI